MGNGIIAASRRDRQRKFGSVNYLVICLRRLCAHGRILHARWALRIVRTGFRRLCSKRYEHPTKAACSSSQRAYDFQRDFCGRTSCHCCVLCKYVGNDGTVMGQPPPYCVVSFDGLDFTRHSNGITAALRLPLRAGWDQWLL